MMLRNLTSVMLKEDLHDVEESDISDAVEDLHDVEKPDICDVFEDLQDVE